MCNRSADEIFWATIDNKKDISVVLESVTAFFVGGKLEGLCAVLAVKF